MKKNLRYQLLIGAILSCFLLGFSCGKSVEPVEPTDFQFYIANVYPSSELFTFHPTTNKIDSISIPWFPERGITASADGKLLYIAQGTSVAVVETDSFSLVTELVYWHEYPVVVSPDNQFIALTGDTLFILRTSDYSLVFSEAIQTAHGRFSSDSKSFYCSSQISPDSFHLVHKVDLSDNLFSVTRKAFPGRVIVHVVPSVDDSKWFLYSNVALWTSAFDVYDVIRDSIIFTHILVPGSGSIATTPDGRYVFYTSPGNTATNPPPDFSFTIFDVNANDIDTVIKDPDFFSDSTWFGAPTSMSVSADGKWLGILGGQMSNVAFYLYDIDNRKLTYRKAPRPKIYEFTGITTQLIK